MGGAVRFPLQRAIIGAGVKMVDGMSRRLGAGGFEMKDVWIAAAGFVFGWLMSKTWQDPGCRVGLAVFLVVTAVMGLAFALAVVGHRRPVESSPEDEDDAD